MNTCRDEILAIWPRLEAFSEDGTVTLQTVVDALRREGTTFSESTIRTHVTSRMCADAPDHHAQVFADLVRMDGGRYRMRHSPTRATVPATEARPTCRCGCGEATSGSRALYRAGHDARHASQVARAIVADPGKRAILLESLPSAALRDKAASIAARRARPEPTKGSTGKQARPYGQTSQPVVEDPLPNVPAGDSSVQREAEVVMLDALAQALRIPLVPERIRLPDGTWVDVDGVSHEPPVLVEAWAHQGKPKSAQRNKVLSDALKLIHVAKILGQEHRRMLCFSDTEAAQPFVGNTWYAAALRDQRVEVHVVALPRSWRTRILEAQQRQYR
ncbi:hypothetical protein [Phytoactinopolyspora halotolerans]|uniref:Uncharacterized protein n=1 Tax=Phytoactinopolyspora halotolerans TaxID=1981512 RepID=A0A6L9SB25_9ACTN|nr:hypothetical protein [Phytoactinopolyspora halotolerans]NEE01200.1 hypothetical protein [Phytoactinopolyspora halotolerans]